MTKPFSATAEQVAQEIDTDLVKGLTSNEASLRYAKNGPNSLGEEKKVPLWKRFLQQFADAMVIILIAAAALSGYMAFKSGGGIEEWIDVFVILAIVILNAILGVYQEGKADQALAALKKMSSPQTKVIRDGKLVMVDSENVVVGSQVSPSQLKRTLQQFFPKTVHWATARTCSTWVLQLHTAVQRVS